jgi:glycosyltransferase involved in cell wall biosynthesis
MEANIPQKPSILSALRESKISIVVPIYNEGANIIHNLEMLIAEIDPYFNQYEVIVVDDGSSDNTPEILATHPYPSVRILRYSPNRGKGFAVRRGFQEATGDLVFFIDGGMELHPKELRIFLALRDLYNADIVVGSKRHPQSEVAYPWYRRGLSVAYQKCMKRLFQLDVTDTQVGIKLFRKEVLDAILPEMTIDRYGFDLEILVLARKHGFTKMLEAPVRLDYFMDNKRNLFSDLLHVAKISGFVMKDTMRIYARTRTLGR